MYKQKGTGGARHGSRVSAVPRRRQGLRPAPRSHAHRPAKKVRALGLKHALSAKVKEGELIVVTASDAAKEPQDQGAGEGAVRKLGLVNALIIDGAEVDKNFASPPATFRTSTCCRPGHQRLRHPAPQEARADQGGRRSAGGAVQMSKNFATTT
jgi:hypothetical protein